jgi:ADP-ribose pyrophosphatase YjhB (NUDIX family)
MDYCTRCAAPLTKQIPEGEDRLRFVCSGCGFIHYQNPVTVVGCIVESEGRILMCRRAIEPASGKWTLPAGFLEMEESSAAGALRETHEEAGAHAEVLGLHSSLDLPFIGQIYSLYRARLLKPEITAGVESLEVAFMEPDSIPWDDLAFPVIHHALRLFLADQSSGEWGVHSGLLEYVGPGSGFDAGSFRLAQHIKQQLRK